MTEFIWGKTFPMAQFKNVPFDDILHGSQVATRTTFFADRNKVAWVDSVKCAYTNRHSNKNYSSWQSVSTMGFFRNSGGYLQPYRAVRSVNKKPWVFATPEPVFHFFQEDRQGDVELISKFREVCGDFLNIKSLYDVYPMAEVMGVDRFEHLPANLRPYMRTLDWNEFLTNAFGKTRVNSTFIKHAEVAEPFAISMAYEFRGLVSDKALIDYIPNLEFNDELMDNFHSFNPALRDVLKVLSKKELNNLMSSTFDLHTTHSIQRISNVLNYEKTRRRAGMEPRKFSRLPVEIKSWKDLTRVV